MAGERRWILASLMMRMLDLGEILLYGVGGLKARDMYWLDDNQELI